MSQTLERIRLLVSHGEVRVSEHGYDELVEDFIATGTVVSQISQAELVEDYPDDPRGPSCLVLFWDEDMNPIHAVWGIALGTTGPAVLVTAYRPDPNRWAKDFKRRLK